MNLEYPKIIQNKITKGKLQEKQEKQMLKHHIAVLVSWEIAEGDNNQVCLSIQYSVPELKQLDLRALQDTMQCGYGKCVHYAQRSAISYVATS